MSIQRLRDRPTLEAADAPRVVGPPLLRPEAADAPPSGIVEVANAGRGRPGVIQLWVGEGNLPTPDFIVDAAVRSLRDGETFYTWQRGLPELRAAIARFMARSYGVPEERERYFVTGGGMQALQIAIRMVAGSGDEVIVPTPAWPNFAAAIGIGGARPVSVPMARDGSGWHLPLDRIAAAITPVTRAIVINSPSNPTGWTATRADLADVLALARRHGLWIVADEIYGRFVYGAARAPSFHDVREEGDAILFVQTLSKNWAMTGWRLGWIEADPALGPVIENLIQFSTSGSPVFVQRAGVAALDGGDGLIDQQIGRCAAAMAALDEVFTRAGRFRFARPGGAFYLFFAIDGVRDTRAAALDLIAQTGVGLAPGTAFGPGGEDHFRLCFARDPAIVREAAERLARWAEAADQSD